MHILLLLIVVAVGIGIAAYVITSDSVPPWLRLLLNILLGIAIFIGIVFGIYVVSAIMAHI